MQGSLPLSSLCWDIVVEHPSPRVHVLLPRDLLDGMYML